ncbi:MAG: hypothetical protein R6X02_21130 [Enhygromyxa sp.]
MHARSSIALAFAVLTVALSGACSPEPDPGEPPAAEFAPICDEAGPVRILNFEPWRVVSSARLWGGFAERQLVSVNYDDTAVASSTLWSVGPCGEAPRLLVSGRFNLRSFPRYDLPFICDHQTGRLHVIDPTGERQPRLVFEAGSNSCYVVITDAGLVTLSPDDRDSETGSLILQPWPEDIWTDEVGQVVLHDRVKIRRMSTGQVEWHGVQGDEQGVFVITVDDELVHLALPGGELELVASGVHRFELSRELDESTGGLNRRHLLWQHIEVKNGDPEDPEAEIRLLDRNTQKLWSLGLGGLQRMPFGTLGWVDQGLVPLRVEVDGELVLRLFRLPALDFIDVDGALEPRYLLAGGRHLLLRGEDSPWHFLDLQTGDWWVPPVLMNFSYWWDRRGATALLEDGQMYWLSGVEPPELIARRAHPRHDFLPDGRLLTVVDVDELGLGDLIVVEPATLEERLIDRGVAVMQARFAWGEDDDLVSYTVLEGERAGLWFARLRPRD